MKQRRYFLAFWPDSEVRDALHLLAKASFSPRIGRLVRRENLHLTLHYFGHLSEDELDCVIRLVGRLPMTAFQLGLDCLGYWKKPKVAWLAPAVTPDALDCLVSALNRGLVDSCDLPVEERRFRPHITLLRKGRPFDEVIIAEPVSWYVSELVLLESVSTPSGVEYRVCQSWEL